MVMPVTEFISVLDIIHTSHRIDSIAAVTIVSGLFANNEGFLIV